MPTRTVSFRVPPEAPAERLDHFLAGELPELSRTHIQHLIRAGRLQVDGRATRRPSQPLRGGERLVLEIVERPPLEAEPEPIPLHVLYEDDDLVAIDKPAGMVMHAGAGQRRGTLVNALLHRYRQLSAVGGPLRPGIVHRLDKLTSGVLLVAKNDQAHRRLAEQFLRREVEKYYLALVHGRLYASKGSISLPVARDRVRRTRMTTRRREGRAALTNYRVLQVTPEFSLVEARLHTGRTHQIRVHFSALGRPVVGDTVYGAPRRLRRENASEPTLERNFLHAHRLCIRHPHTGRLLDIRSPLPPELTAFLQRWGLAAPVLN